MQQMFVPARQMPQISVVIPCRDEAEFITVLLDAVRAQQLPPSETIVVDNGSRDNSVAIVQGYAREHPELHLRVLSCARPGAAAAMNTGIRAATGDIIVRIDGHSRPRPDYIRRAVARLAEPKAGVVGGVWEIEPGAPTLRARAIALAVRSRLGSGGAAYRHSDAHREPKDVDTVPFGCYRKALWRQLNGYDDELLVVEDGDFNYRVRQAGYRVILDPQIRCVYVPRRRMRTLGRQYLRYGWWKIPMLMRHPGAARLRQMIPLGFVTIVLALAFGSAFSMMIRAALLALLAVYAVAIVASGFYVAQRARDLRLWPAVTAAFAVIHFAWGLGGLTHILTMGRWPAWRLPPSEQRA
jgi:glycosyltransferase involved in cell wall biosynthesis